jgi:hypothetical protein
MKRLVSACLLLAGCTLAGCSLGSGYAIKSSSADNLDGNCRKQIIDESVSQSKAYTDQRIAELLKTQAR